MDRDAPGGLSTVAADPSAVRKRDAPRLFAESFAPWCEKARWALDHHGVAYRWHEHVPLAGELALRLAARRWRGRVTVPLLVADGLVLMDSFEIARFAERVGRGCLLFPAGQDDTIARWNQRSEALMVAGRALLLQRMLVHPGALREQLPPAIPRWLRPRLEGVAAFGVRFLMRKYDVHPDGTAQPGSSCRLVLDVLRKGLRAGDGHLVNGRLSLADIAMATALQFIRPVDDRYMPLGPQTREAWTHAGLAAGHPDLLDWRDGLYAGLRSVEGIGPANGAPSTAGHKDSS